MHVRSNEIWPEEDIFPTMRHLKSVFNRMSLLLPENENKNELECVGEFLCSFSLFLSKSIEVQSEFLPINNSEAAYKSIACQENRCFFFARHTQNKF